MDKILIVRALVCGTLMITGVFAKAETVKIAMIESMSGTFANLGLTELRTFQLVIDEVNKRNAANGVQFEVTAFDGKGSPQESLTQLKTVIDQGFRYITQGNGSAVGLALEAAVTKHNEREPGHEILYLNHSAIDPEMTNGKCSFWHFRFDANSDMKAEALTSAIKDDPSIIKVYIIGQDYSYGRAVSAAAKAYLKRKRPDIIIVGDAFHPIATVKDFSPYVANIKASGADTVITGNWGADLGLLIRAANNSGLNTKFYTFYASNAGVPTIIGDSGGAIVKLITPWHPNNETFSGKELAEQYRKRYNDDFSVPTIFNTVEMLSAAMQKAHSTDPKKVAFALEGMQFRSFNGNVVMRASDHQAIQPLYVAAWAKVDGKSVVYDQEKTGFGWKTEKKLDAFVSAQPTSCQMQRPPP